MKNSVAIVGATVLGFVVFVATLTLARHEYAVKLLSNAEATALWKESDSVSDAIIHSHVIEKLNNGDKTSALQALCNSLREDLRSLEDLAELSKLDDKRKRALSKGHAAYNQWCVNPHA